MRVRQTHPAKHLAVLRLAAAVPLIGIGAQHILGSAPMLPILEGAQFPFASFFAVLVPWLEIVAGAALVVGFFARPAALTALVIMGAAVYAHAVHDWADEPIIVLPLAVAICVAQVLWGGAGAFSIDLVASDPN
ncbi:MAG: DoxX family protein [Acidobacteriota bacterium]